MPVTDAREVNETEGDHKVGNPVAGKDGSLVESRYPQCPDRLHWRNSLTPELLDVSSTLRATDI